MAVGAAGDDGGMDTGRGFHSASQRGAAIRRILDERRADRHHRVVITISGSAVTLDGVVECYADKEAAVDAALWAGEADVIVDRIVVGQQAPADCGARGRQALANARYGREMTQ